MTTPPIVRRALLGVEANITRATARTSGAGNQYLSIIAETLPASTFHRFAAR